MNLRVEWGGGGGVYRKTDRLIEEFASLLEALNEAVRRPLQTSISFTCPTPAPIDSSFGK